MSSPVQPDIRPADREHWTWMSSAVQPDISHALSERCPCVDGASSQKSHRGGQTTDHAAPFCWRRFSGDVEWYFQDVNT